MEGLIQENAKRCRLVSVWSPSCNAPKAFSNGVDPELHLFENWLFTLEDWYFFVSAAGMSIFVFAVHRLSCVPIVCRLRLHSDLNQLVGTRHTFWVDLEGSCMKECTQYIFTYFICKCMFRKPEQRVLWMIV